MEFDSEGRLIVPKAILERKEARVKQEREQKAISRAWNLLDFDLKKVFLNMAFVNSFKSVRNNYFLFQYDKYYLLSTGLKPITRLNVVLKDDLDEFYSILSNEKFFSDNYFDMKKLIDFFSTFTFTSNRINEIRLDEDLSKPLNNFYTLILNFCYVLVASNKLGFQKSGNALEFYLTKTNNKNSENIFGELIFLGKISAKRHVFEDEKFYYSLQINNFRGSLTPYIKKEILFLNNLVVESNLYRLDIDELVEKMDYYKRFHDIYNIVMDQNIRNERDVHTYLNSRVKSALKIVALLNDDLNVEKEGRSLIFIKKSNRGK